MMENRLGPLPKGVRTPPEAFYRPILHILTEFGGVAQSSDVLVRLEQTMKGKLKGVDYNLLRSGEIRWRKTANFARDTLVKTGLLKRGSPRGIWEISDLGRTALTEGDW